MVILGLGSNISKDGDPSYYLKLAIQVLRSHYSRGKLEVLNISPLYESDALLPVGAPKSWDHPFLNLCVLCKTTLSPLELLEHAKSIEQSLGRKDRERWAPREIDIDILAMNSLIIQNEKLTLPHPGLLTRPFALLPFADLVPHWKFETLNSTALELTSELRKSSGPIPFRTRRSTHFLTEFVGILNLTPDSFSDGGRFNGFESAIQQANHLISLGAHVIDLGAESTAPGASKVSPDEEWNRLAPVLEKLTADLQSRERSNSLRKISISVDTRHAATAVRSIKAGADWINDVCGFQDSAMREAVAASDASLVMMHSLSVPPDRNNLLPEDCDPVSTLLLWAEQRIQDLMKMGTARNRIIFDPGIGFGKTLSQNWDILRNAHRFHELGVRLLVGHSRKSFLTSLTQLAASERDPETIAISQELAAKNVDFIRVHHIDGHVRALKAWTQVR